MKEHSLLQLKMLLFINTLLSAILLECLGLKPRWLLLENMASELSGNHLF